MRKLLYVYILECADGSYYVGVTNNPERRLAEHNDGLNQNSYTYLLRPCKMVYLQGYTNFMEAINWETRIKKWSHAKKKALIDGDFSALQKLSKKKFV